MRRRCLILASHCEKRKFPEGEPTSDFLLLTIIILGLTPGYLASAAGHQRLPGELPENCAILVRVLHQTDEAQNQSIVKRAAGMSLNEPSEGPVNAQVLNRAVSRSGESPPCDTSNWNCGYAVLSGRTSVWVSALVRILGDSSAPPSCDPRHYLTCSQ
jgi:hypothetical protein